MLYPLNLKIIHASKKIEKVIVKLHFTIFYILVHFYALWHRPLVKGLYSLTLKAVLQLVIVT